MESIAAVPAAKKQKVEFSYDSDGRRISKKAYTWNSSTNVYDLAKEIHFIYDGWLCLAEVNADMTSIRTYTWGLDLSKSFEGAGGVGGLLAITDAATSITYNVSYDGNGNVVKLTNDANGTVAASYEYNPFGEVIEMTGSYASSNPYRFSTKYQDTETGLNYYGYRYYSSNLGRWINRDPIEEEGGLNLYGFVRNSPIIDIDYLGQFNWMQWNSGVHSITVPQLIPQIPAVTLSLQGDGGNPNWNLTVQLTFSWAIPTARFTKYLKKVNVNAEIGVSGQSTLKLCRDRVIGGNPELTFQVFIAGTIGAGSRTNDFNGSNFTRKKVGGINVEDYTSNPMQDANGIFGTVRGLGEVTYNLATKKIGWNGIYIDVEAGYRFYTYTGTLPPARFKLL